MDTEALEPTDVIDPAHAPLLPRHLLLVDAFLGPAEFNASEAARIAGYTDNDTGSIRVQASRVLSRANVQREIQTRLQAARVTPEFVLSGLVGAAEGARSDHAWGAVVAAYRELGRTLAMFTDKTELDMSEAIRRLAAETGLDPQELADETKRLSRGS